MRVLLRLTIQSYLTTNYKQKKKKEEQTLPGITFTEQDMKEVGDLQAGWYNLNVKSMTEGPGKNDPSATSWATVFVIKDGPFEGREVRNTFSTNFKSMVYKFLKCFTEVKAGTTIPIEDTIGRDVQGYIVMDPTSGYPNIKDFKPIGR